MQIPRQVILHLDAFESAGVAAPHESGVLRVSAHVDRPPEIYHLHHRYPVVPAVPVKIQRYCKCFCGI